MPKKALEIAAERYAQGEISREEFEDINKTLGTIKLAPVEQTSLIKDKEKILANRSNELQDNISKPSTEFYDIVKIQKILNGFLVVSAVVSCFAAINIFKENGIQQKYNKALLYENDPALLLMQTIPVIIAMVLFLFWKKKSTDNLVALKGTQSITPAGAVYWYFIPIFSFWKPFVAMKNLVDGFRVIPDGNYILLYIWWGLFWGSALVAIAIGVIYSEGVSTEQQAASYSNWSIIIYLLDAISIWVTLQLVQKVTDAQKVTIKSLEK